VRRARTASRPGFAAAALSALVLAVGVTAAAAQVYPKQPVKLITQSPVGNGPDITARFLADRFGELWGQQVVVINRPGGGGMIAAQEAARAPADGYTLYMPNSSTFLVLPAAHEKLPVDLARDYVPIGFVGEGPIIIAVAPSFGAGTLAELIACAKEKPGEINFSAIGRGTLPHLTSELFQRRAGIKMTYVPYTASASVLHDVMGGRLSLVFDGFSALAGALESGALVPLAVTSRERLAQFPNVPTVAETLPDFVAMSWFPLMAPAGTPEAIIRKVNADLATILAQPRVQERFTSLGFRVRPMSPEATAAFIHSEQQRWKPVLDEAGLKPR
jgi:tripartite-type tricarboxylate transporter receptor subunit TctC